MMRRIHFHGYLRELVPQVIEIDADDVASAIDGATRQLPQLAPDPVRGRHRMSVVGCHALEDLRRTDMVDIHLIPQLSGGKEGGFTQIIIGATLIVAGLFMGGTTWPLFFMTMGASMAVGGVMQLMAPAPQRDQARGDPEASKYLGTPGNTVGSGTRIPILVGKDRVYGHFLSFNINAKDVAV